MSMQHKDKIRVALSESVVKNTYGAPSGDNTMTSFPANGIT